MVEGATAAEADSVVVKVAVVAAAVAVVVVAAAVVAAEPSKLFAAIGARFFPELLSNICSQGCRDCPYGGDPQRQLLRM